MLALVALILFVLATFGVTIGGLALLPLGLAFLAAHLLFGTFLTPAAFRGP